MEQSSGETLTVGDYVQSINKLNGTIRFIGEIHQRNGIYYGIELDEAYGKSDGTVGPIRYFKCKTNRGIFVRRRNISHLHRRSKLTSQRIGIHNTVRIALSTQQRPVGTIRFIGTLSKHNTVYYGVEFRKPLGDSDGSFKGAPLFTSKPNYAYFIRATSRRITFPVVTNSPAPHPRSKSGAFPNPKQSKQSETKFLITPHRNDTRNSSVSSETTDSEDNDDDEDREEAEDEEEEDEKPRRGNTLQVLRQNAKNKRHSSPSPSGPHGRTDSNKLIWRLSSPDRYESDSDSSEPSNERAKTRRARRRHHSAEPHDGHGHQAHSQSHGQSLHHKDYNKERKTSSRGDRRFRSRHQIARSADYTNPRRSASRGREEREYRNERDKSEREHHRKRRKRQTYDSHSNHSNHSKYHRKYQSSDIDSLDEEEEPQRAPPDTQQRRPKSARGYESPQRDQRNGFKEERGQNFNSLPKEQQPIQRGRSFKKRRKREGRERGGRVGRSKKRYYSSSEETEETDRDTHQVRNHGRDHGRDHGASITSDEQHSDRDVDPRDREHDQNEEKEALPDEDEKEELIVEYEQHYNDRAKILFRLETEHRRIVNEPTDFDPLERLGDWIQSAKRANTFKKRYECIQSLMRRVCGGKHEELPMKWKATTNPAAILDLLAKWLDIEDTIVVRKHILQLLIPLGNSGYPMGLWVESSKSIAKSIITKQWLEKKRSFAQLTTPALIRVYIASHSSLQFWKEWIGKALLSPYTHCQAQCWQFLARILEIAMVRKSVLWVYQDLEQFVNVGEGRIMSIAKETIINTEDEELKLSCCLFVYGVARCFNSSPAISMIYREIVRTEHDVYFEGISRSKMGKIFKKMAVRKRKKVQSIQQSVSQNVSPISIHSPSPISGALNVENNPNITSEDEEENGVESQDSETSHHEDDNENDHDQQHEAQDSDEMVMAEAEIVNDSFCTRCTRKNGKIKDMALEMNKLRGEREGLRELVGNLKTERNALKKDEKQWTVKVDESKKSYQETKGKMTAMEQQLLALRKRLYELKKKERLRVLGRSNGDFADLPDVQRLDEWTSYHLLDWMVTLEDGRFMKYEAGISEYVQQHSINGNGLRDITESVLRSAGMHRFGDRKAMMQCIKRLVGEYDEWTKKEEQQKTVISDKMARGFPLNVLPQRDEDEEVKLEVSISEDAIKGKIAASSGSEDDIGSEVEHSQNTEVQSVLSEQLEGAQKGIVSEDELFGQDAIAEEEEEEEEDSGHDDDDHDHDQDADDDHSENVSNHSESDDHSDDHSNDNSEDHSDDNSDDDAPDVIEDVIVDLLDPNNSASDSGDSIHSALLDDADIVPKHSPKKPEDAADSKTEDLPENGTVLYPDRGSVLLDVNHPMFSGINQSVEIHENVRQPDPFEQLESTNMVVTVTKVEESEDAVVDAAEPSQDSRDTESTKKSEEKVKEKKSRKKKKKKECNQCYERKPKSEGYADEDGVWYCNDCWDEFNENQDDVEEETDDGTHLKPNGSSHVRSSSDPKGRRAASLTDLLNGKDLFQNLKKEEDGKTKDDDDDSKEDSAAQQPKEMVQESKDESASTNSSAVSHEEEQFSRKRTHRKRKSVLDDYDLTKLKEFSYSQSPPHHDDEDGGGGTGGGAGTTDESSTDDDDDHSGSEEHDDDSKSSYTEVTSSRRSSDFGSKKERGLVPSQKRLDLENNPTSSTIGDIKL